MPLARSPIPSRCDPLSEVPQIGWARVVGLALALIACVIAGLESYWRVQGFQPSVADSPGLWYFWRQQVYRRDGKVIVLTGTSRVCACVSLATMREYLPDYEIVQLGIPGDGSCIGLLQDLVDDPEFRGIVICELDTPLLERARWDGHRDFRTYRPPTAEALIECVVKAWFEDRLVCTSEQLALRKLVAKLLLRTSRSLRPSRSRRTFRRELHYAIRNAAEISLQGADDADVYVPEEPTVWHDFANDMHDMNRMVQRLHSRGGEVVFLRAPSTGAEWKREQVLNATLARWDCFARESVALCIHFRDVPEMLNLSCADGSHLDYRDAPQFTRALVSRLNFLTSARGGSSTKILHIR
jgi:hypothetical protein